MRPNVVARSGGQLTPLVHLYPERMETPDRAGRFDVGPETTASANRAWWDGEAGDYLNEHGTFLGDAEFIWGPEGWREDELQLLGALEGLDVLEFGAGAAQAGRCGAGQGARVVATDLSLGMLLAAQHIDDRRGTTLPLAQCDARRLPFAEETFDLAFSAFGAVPFIADTAALMRELHRVLRPGGRVAFSTTHPIRWVFPDVPDGGGLVATHSYFDTTPYVEARGDQVLYSEHHRTLEQRVHELLDAGFLLEQLRELPWKTTNDQTWGGWSPQRGRLFPGTLVLVGRKR